MCIEFRLDSTVGGKLTNHSYHFRARLVPRFGGKICLNWDRLFHAFSSFCFVVSIQPRLKHHSTIISDAKTTFSYSETPPYGHLTSKKTSPLQSPWISPKLYSTLQITPCNKVTSPLRSLLPSPVGDLNSEVPLYIHYCILWQYANIYTDNSTIPLPVFE